MTGFPHKRAYRIVSWSLFGLWFATLNVLSSMPIPEMPPALDWSFGDKFAHISIFGAGAFLLAIAWSSSSPGVPLRRFVIVFLLLTAFGVADEFRQLWVPGRMGADPGDMLANLTGSFAGALLAWFFIAAFHRKKRPHHEPRFRYRRRPR